MKFFEIFSLRSVGRISAVLSPIWLKFWPKVGLASPLDCYSMKKSGCLLKKRSFRRFPSLVGTPFSSNASRSVGRISAVLSPIWLKFWPKVGLASLLDCYSMKKSGCLLKKRSLRRFPSLVGLRAQSGVFVQRCSVRQRYLGRFKPALAQILGAGSPDPSRDLLFYASKR